MCKWGLAYRDTVQPQAPRTGQMPPLPEKSRFGGPVKLQKACVTGSGVALFMLLFMMWLPRVFL